MDLVGLADLHVALALRLRRPRQLTLEKKEPKTTCVIPESRSKTVKA